MNIQSTPPICRQDNPHAQHQAAQIAADADNFHTAVDRLFSEHTPALNTTENMKIVKEKFPFPIQNPISSAPHPSTRSTSNLSPFSMPPPLTDTQPYL
jgi:hypothetical protein